MLNRENEVKGILYRLLYMKSKAMNLNLDNVTKNSIRELYREEYVQYIKEITLDYNNI